MQTSVSTDSLRCMTIYRYTTSVCNQPFGWLSLLPSLWMEISTGQGTVAVLCAGKVTTGLALHQPRVTGSVIISTYMLNGLRKGDKHPTYTPVRCIALYYLWSPYIIGQTIIFSSCFFLLLLLLSFFPRLISVVGDWMFTILWHMVWP